MEKNRVEVLVRDLMNKLHIRNRKLKNIMQCYTADCIVPIIKYSSNLITNVFLGNKSVENDEKDNDKFPESARMVFYPWEDVIGSMMEHPENVQYVETVCCHCGEKLLLLEFWTPRLTWKGLCGRSGLMLICPNCPRQDSFSLHLMS